MGARVEDYKAVAPKNSFLHVDNFASPKELAEHLKLLDQNSALYNRHFQVYPINHSYLFNYEVNVSYNTCHCFAVGGNWKVSRFQVSVSSLLHAPSSSSSSISLRDPGLVVIRNLHQWFLDPVDMKNSIFHLQ